MRRSLAIRHDAMRLREPFRIAGYLFESMPAIIASITEGGVTGRGEAAGVYYLADDPAHMRGEIERCRAAIEDGAGREDLLTLLPSGGARNALDCALWELESLRTEEPVWRMAGLAPPRPLVTTFTIPAVDPAEMAARLAPLGAARSLKLKLEGDLAADLERLRALRRERPDIWLAVDANQGYTADRLDALASLLVAERVALLEQPVARGDEASLEGWRSPIPLAGDESIQNLEELRARHHYFDVINIKLDKCGGLTEALRMAAAARRLGKQVMVGNMAGSTLATAPGFVLGQVCDVVDLDGPYFLADDPLASALFSNGLIDVPERLWGASPVPAEASA